MSENIVIGAVPPRIQEQADGIQTAFIYPFAIFEEEDLEVYLDEVLQTSGYTISGAGETEGGLVTFDEAPQAGVVVTLRRYLVIERNSDFAEGGAFHADVINKELDYLVAVAQQNADDLDRVLVLNPTDANASLAMPAKEERASRVLAFDEDGSPTSGPTVSDVDNAQAAAATATTKATEASNSAETANQAKLDAQAAAAAISTEMVEEVSSSDSPITVTNNTYYNLETTAGEVEFVLPSINVSGEPFRFIVNKKNGDVNGFYLRRDGSDLINELASDYFSDTKGATSVRADDTTGVDNWVVNNLGWQIANPERDVFEAGVDFVAGMTTQLTASKVIDNHKTLQVFVNGTKQVYGVDFTVNGALVEFSEAIPNDVEYVEFDYIETAEIGAPADNTVTTVKLQDDVVTDAKLTDTGVTPGEYNSVTVNAQGRVTSAQNVNTGPFTEEFISDELTYSNGNSYTVSHDLTKSPTLVELVMVCQTAEHGYAVGDEVRLGNAAVDVRNGSGSAGLSGVSWAVSGTDIKYSIATYVRVISYSSPTGFPTLSASNWKIKIRAWT